MISVIMPTHNTDILMLKEAVDSILNQTYTDFEFIIIDDCSQNETPQYLASLSDERIRVITNTENLGITKSLNVGLRAAEGDYIARMDADDISLPDRFQRQFDFMEANPDIIVCGTWIQAFGGKHYIQKRVIPEREYLRCSMLFGNQYGLSHPTAFFRASELRKHSIEYDEELPTAQDYGMWSVCCEYGNIANVPEILLHYRVHDKQISIEKHSIQMECTKLVQKKLLSRLCIEALSDVDTHYQACFETGVTSKAEKWFTKLTSINKNKGIYDRCAFKKCLRDMKRCKLEQLIVQTALPKNIFSIYSVTSASQYLRVTALIVKRGLKRS